MNSYKSIDYILFLSIASIIFLNNFLNPAYARLKNQKDSNNFLNEYCIEIVNSIKDAYEIQIKSLENEDFKKFGKKGRWIS